MMKSCNGCDDDSMESLRIVYIALAPRNSIKNLQTRNNLLLTFFPLHSDSVKISRARGNLTMIAAPRRNPHKKGAENCFSPPIAFLSVYDGEAIIEEKSRKHAEESKSLLAFLPRDGYF